MPLDKELAARIEEVATDSGSTKICKCTRYAGRRRHEGTIQRNLE
jgi:hypothetical protein